MAQDNFDEKKWMKKFFSEFFLESSAIYVVFGSKPLSSKALILASEIECRETLSKYAENEDAKTKKRALKSIKQYCSDIDFPQNWARWIAYCKKYPDSPFLYATRKTDNEKIQLGYILNVQQMVWILKKYYQIFRSELNEEFDPVEAVLEFDKPDSPFWNKIFSNDYLTGLVYGYGEKNAFFFALERSYKNRDPHHLFANISPPISKDKSASIKNIELPKFRSYRLCNVEDPVLEQYKKERSVIQEYLSDTNFFEKTFQRLTGNICD